MSLEALFGGQPPKRNIIAIVEREPELAALKKEWEQRGEVFHKRIAWFKERLADEVAVENKWIMSYFDRVYDLSVTKGWLPYGSSRALQFDMGALIHYPESEREGEKQKEDVKRGVSQYINEIVSSLFHKKKQEAKGVKS